jgi:peptidoglycan/LPS O-acetylase OafA/YrhL
MKYRLEIDGLRAIAVLAVFLFHLEIKGFSGGFVGVDVFFVISGYLITGVLQKDLDRDSFSIIGFYDRRVRRIFPALYLILLVTFAVAYLVFMTNEFQAFCKSLVSSLLFYSNFHFWSEAGYFDVTSELKPLLHTWSLSIEEQFYIFFPTFLYLIHRYFPKYKSALIAGCFWISFVGCILLTRKNDLVAFYFSPVRAWELLLGAMLAIGAFPLIKHKMVKQIGSVAGLLLVMYSIFRFSAKTPFPGYRALIPCVGTALLIHCTGNRQVLTWMDRLLSLQPMTWIGKISYSLYLWHWPAIVFTKHVIQHKIRWTDQLWIVVITFVGAYLSWRYVEQPFRAREGRFKDFRSMFKFLGVVTVFLLLLSVAGGFLTDGFPHRFSPAVLRYANGSTDRNPDRARCHEMSIERVRSNDLCVIGVQNNKAPDFIVWGDSFAEAMMPAIKEMAEKKKVYGLFASASACAPILDVERKIKGVQLECNKFNHAMIGVIRNLKIKNVLLISQWDMEDYYLTNNNQAQSDFIKKSKKYDFEQVKIFYSGFDKTLSELHNVDSQTWIFQMIPRPGYYVPIQLSKYERSGFDRKELEIKRSKFDEERLTINEVLDSLAKKHSFQVIDPSSILCPNNCIVEMNGYALYYDKKHLSGYGARLVAPTLDPFFNSFIKP